MIERLFHFWQDLIRDEQKQKPDAKPEDYFIEDDFTSIFAKGVAAQALRAKRAANWAAKHKPTQH